MEYQNIQLSHCAPDELTDIIDSAEMTHQFLPGGAANIVTESVLLDDAIFQRGHYGMGVHVKGNWPTGMVCLGMVLESLEPCAVNGFLAPGGSAQLYGESVELSYRAPPKSNWFFFCAEREAIQRTMLQLFDREMMIPSSGAVSLSLSEDSKIRLRATIARFFHLASISKGGAADVETLRALKHQFLLELVIGQDENTSRSRVSSRRFAKERQQFMYKVNRFYHQNCVEPFCLSSFASHVGCSERMLEYQFRQLYGTSPSVWFRSMKMNEINKVLRQTPRSGLQVSELAMEWGFFHLGRFSREYRSLFGESPSRTLKNSRTTT